MRTEDEIREKIEQLKSNRDTVEFRSAPYYRCSAGVYFLEWVLQEDRKEVAMSEITRLYENAGVLKECLSPCYINKTWRKTYDCPNCNNREEYPPFTAEKQLNILKIIVHSFGFNSLDKPIWDKGWDIAIAKLANIYWEVLMEKEKQQIKEILNG